MVKYMVSVALVSFVLGVVVPGNVDVVDGVCVGGVPVCEVALNGQLKDGILDQSLDSIHIDQQIALREIGLKELGSDGIKDLALDSLQDGLPVHDADALGDLGNLTAQLELSTLSDLQTL